MVFAFAGLGWVVLMCLVLPLRICLVMLGFGCSIVIRAGLRCCFIVMYYYVAGFVRLLVCFGCVVNSVVIMCSFIWFGFDCLVWLCLGFIGCVLSFMPVLFTGLILLVCVWAA